MLQIELGDDQPVPAHPGGRHPQFADRGIVGP
jgi:hypothetical protein